MRSIHTRGLGLAFAMVVTVPLGAQTTSGADSVAMLRARFKASLRAHADSALANVEPRLTAALRVAQADHKAVLVYAVREAADTVFDAFVQSVTFGRLMRDNFVVVRLTRDEGEAISGNPRADSTSADSTVRAVATAKLSTVDRAGHVSRLPPMVSGRLMDLWTASQRLQQLAPRLTEANRQRIVDYLMLWARGN